MNLLITLNRVNSLEIAQHKKVTTIRVNKQVLKAFGVYSL